MVSVMAVGCSPGHRVAIGCHVRSCAVGDGVSIDTTVMVSVAMKLLRISQIFFSAVKLLFSIASHWPNKKNWHESGAARAAPAATLLKALGVHVV